MMIAILALVAWWDSGYQTRFAMLDNTGTLGSGDLLLGHWVGGLRAIEDVGHVRNGDFGSKEWAGTGDLAVPEVAASDTA